MRRFFLILFCVSFFSPLFFLFLPLVVPLSRGELNQRERKDAARRVAQAFYRTFTSRVAKHSFRFAIILQLSRIDLSAQLPCARLFVRTSKERRAGECPFFISARACNAIALLNLSTRNYYAHMPDKFSGC